MDNLASCPKCDAPLIAEELKMHRCFGEIKSVILKDGKYWVSDGQKVYRWFRAPPKSNTRFKHPEGSTMYINVHK